MSSKLATLLPQPPLTDEVFSFNQPQFGEVQDFHAKDAKFLSSGPVRTIVHAGDKMGGAATGVTSGVGHLAQGAVGLWGSTARATTGFSGRLNKLVTATEDKLKHGIDKVEKVAEHLVDPGRVVREHINYSNGITDALPDTIREVDSTITRFCTELGNNCQELHEKIPTKGVQIITSLQGHLEPVFAALSKMIDILSKNDIEQQLKIGKEKYRGIRGIGTNHLAELSDLLPQVLNIIRDVKSAFEVIGANLKLAKETISHGVTDPHQVFAESFDDVINAWRAYETKRKTMTLAF
ncbi:hypothetical protein BDZ94DRAFT_1263482 [Collybia nuda]|uniref:Uncharacterized protein n=1 Tax=Collybia nuda TaxID=64659 RepID=A0A9P5Y561_9AGAR|nr:hypothetical protein BDZ94DRAFT_1263482 [Collybia nuda]